MNSTRVKGQKAELSNFFLRFSGREKKQDEESITIFDPHPHNKRFNTAMVLALADLLKLSWCCFHLASANPGQNADMFFREMARICT